jgi:hypothetical protein
MPKIVFQHKINKYKQLNWQRSAVMSSALHTVGHITILGLVVSLTVDAGVASLSAWTRSSTDDSVTRVDRVVFCKADKIRE